MKAWGIDQKVNNKVTMLGDGNGAAAKVYIYIYIFTNIYLFKFNIIKAMGLDVDLAAHNLGVRNKRYAIVVDKNVVTHIGFDGDSFAEKILALLKK